MNMPWGGPANDLPQKCDNGTARALYPNFNKVPSFPSLINFRAYDTYELLIT
mgnify:CR=1 FL=1